MPVVSAGIRGLRVLKTTQSAFTNFVRDEYRTLPDAADRLFSTVVTADWTYGTTNSSLDYDAAHATVQATVLEVFAGPADKGVFSASVQQSQHLTQQLVLDRVPQVAPPLGSSSRPSPGRHHHYLDAERPLLRVRLL
jgi:urate oxidase